MSRLRGPRVVSAVVGVLVVSTLAGCAMGVGYACTEAGWINRVEIGVRGAGADAVADLEVCIDDVCTDADGAGRVWATDVGMTTPPEIVVTALAADGRRLARDTLAVTWTATDSPNGPGCLNGSTSDRVFLEMG